MTPPIRSPHGSGPVTTITSEVPSATEVGGTGDSPPSGPESGPRASILFRPPPLLNLRPEFRNPIRSPRPIETLGDIRDALIEDFVRGQLGPGAQIVQLLGSFPGHLHPELPLSSWNPDQKPDINVVGDAESILRNLQPLMGWSEQTLQENIDRARHGMVYFNLALETRAGPVPLKMGVLDRWVLRSGNEPYFSLRAALLPDSESYVFLDPDPEVRAEFERWSIDNKARFLEHAVDTLAGRPTFHAEDLARRWFRLQFFAYETYRFFDWPKGPRQYARLEPWVPEILAPAVRRYLETHRELKAYAPSIHPGIEMNPESITSENVMQLQFVWGEGGRSRSSRLLGGIPRFLSFNARMGRQTFRNIGSNGTSRPGYHRIDWFNYGLRKFSRLFGMGGEAEPRQYSPDASRFSHDIQRTAGSSSPLRQMVILAGYDPGNEDRPEVLREIVRYAENEINKGAVPNPLFRGIEPSKFTIPVRGVPSLAYQLMNGLMSEGLEHVVVVGTPDSKIVFNRFVEFYADEIKSRGKTFRFEPQAGTMTEGLRRGIEASPYHDEPVVTGFGDNPLIDMERIVHHPERRLVDWIVAANSRSRLLHDGAKNYHVEGQNEGVSDPSKEGNAYTYPGDTARVPWALLQAIFDSRKSMADGSKSRSKLSIIGEILFGMNSDEIFRRNVGFSERLRILGSNLARSVRTSPTLLDGFHFFFGDLLPRSVALQFRQRVFRQKVPSAGLSLELSERILESRLGIKSSLAPNHSDPGGVLDIDGVLDLAIAKGVMEGTEHPERIYPHWDKLAPFAEAIRADRDSLPSLEGTPERVNRMFARIREALLEKGFTDEVLRSKGFNPEEPPMREDGSINPRYLETLFPNGQFHYFREAWEAYNRRGDHAAGLENAFHERIEATRPVSPELRQVPLVERFVFSQLNADPERSRALLIEWNFGRINDALLSAARARHGADSVFVQNLQSYLEASTTGNQDTALRRVYTGFKAVDVLRRSTAQLAPEEFRSLYPQLVEAIHDARSAVPGGQGRLSGLLDWAQTTADREFVRKVGESPPPYRSRGLAGTLLPHTNTRSAVLRGPAPRPAAAPAGGGDVAGDSGVRPMSSLSGEVRRVDSPAYLQTDLNQFARRLGILPSRIPHLIAAASGVENRESLSRIVSERMTVERLREWVQSPEGRTFMAERGDAFRDTFHNRLREGGPGLAMGLVSLLGAEQLADVVGLDARNHPQERFMFVVGLSHIAGNVTSAGTEVFLNRSLGSAFNFVETRAVAAGGEAAVQFSFEARSSLGRALFDSLTRNFGLTGGLGRIAWNGTRGLVTMPFRAAWGMGPGLMASAIVDRTIGSQFAEGSRARSAIRFGSFFLPDLYRIGVGGRGPAIFETAGLRWASRAFAAGFIADMAFSGYNRWQYGAGGSVTRNMIYQRANQLHNADEGTLHRVVDGAFEMIAPQVSAWWDSVELDGFGFRPNRYQDRAREELRSFSQQTSERADETLRHSLLFGTGGANLEESFYTQVDWSFLRGENRLVNVRLPDGRELPVRDVLEQLQDPAVARRFSGPGAHEDQVAYIQRQFSGYRLSRAEVEQILDRISLHVLRNDLVSVVQFELPENAALRELFDERGTLRPGGEAAALRRLFPGHSPSEAEILRQRRVGLALRILQAQSGSDPAAAEPYLAVGRRIGLVDGAGTIVDPEIRALAEAQLRPARERSLANGLSLTTGLRPAPRSALALRLGASTSNPSS
ncbi:MAG: hypothetical protein U1F66_01650 [bacterium]